MLVSHCRGLGFGSMSSFLGFVVDEVKLEVLFHIALNFYTVIIIL
jgi:hypothetical protein